VPEQTSRPPAAELVPAWLRRAGAYSWRILLLLGAAALVLWVLARVRVVVVPVVAALLIAALFDPLARRLRPTRLPDSLVALAVLLAVLLVFAVAGLLIVPEVVGQLSEVNINVNKGLERIQSFVLNTFPVSRTQIDEALSQGFSTIQSRIGDIAGSVFGAAGVAVEAVFQAFVTLFLLFFFVKDGPRFYRWLKRAVPESRVRDVEELLPRIWATLRAYLLGVVIIGFIDAFFIGLALLVLGVPLVVPLAVLTFFGAFFPIVGAVIVGAIATLVALVSEGLGSALILLGVTIAVQQFEGNVLQPLIMGRQVDLHPAITLLSVAAGGAVAGVAGAILAVPVAAVVRMIARYASPRLAAAGDAARRGTVREEVAEAAPAEP
jgi:predicted PurR-regulated permease PerM